MTVEQMVNNFISRSPDFYSDKDLDNIDSKHKEIVYQAYQQLKNIDSINFRNWSFQHDLGAPSQINLNYGLIRGIARPLYKKIFQRQRELMLMQALLDDLSIITSINANPLLTDNPVHLTPGVSDYFKIGKLSVNFRWLRYIYLTKRICDLNILSTGGVWMDIGSYYGGLQGLVHKYNPKARIIMVDFYHQLCRSYIYLSNLCPKANHVFPDQIDSLYSFDEIQEGSFVYIPVDKFENIAKFKVDLATNFFSFGEMKRQHFTSYINSQVVAKSKCLFLVNRFVSAPFFDPTYDTDLNILDYIKNERSIDYFDVFPMHHYFPTYRKLFDRIGFRNVSSSYFEYISSINLK